MHRKLTITVTEDVYDGLYRTVGRGEISRFIEELVRPYVVAESDLDREYQAMAEDAQREREAWEWVEAENGEELE